MPLKYFTQHWPEEDYQAARELAVFLNESFRSMLRRLVSEEAARVGFSDGADEKVGQEVSDERTD